MNPTINDLADKCTTDILYAALCRECGTDAVTEENAILSAVGAANVPSVGTESYWLFLAEQTVTAQDEHDNEYNASRGG